MQVMIRCDSVDILSTLVQLFWLQISRKCIGFGCSAAPAQRPAAYARIFRSIYGFFVRFCTPACCLSYGFIYCPAAFRTVLYTVLLPIHSVSCCFMLLFGSGHLKCLTNFSSWSIGRLHKGFLVIKNRTVSPASMVSWRCWVAARLWRGYD